MLSLKNVTSMPQYFIKDVARTKQILLKFKLDELFNILIFMVNLLFKRLFFTTLPYNGQIVCHTVICSGVRLFVIEYFGGGV